MTVDGDRSDSVWHLLPQDTNTSATAVNADRTDRLARPERIWVEAAHNLNFWRTEIGSLANTAIQKDHRKNPGGIFNELPFQWLNNLVDKELKLTKSIMLFVEVVNAWFERRSEEERQSLTKWVEGLDAEARLQVRRGRGLLEKFAHLRSGGADVKREGHGK